MGRKRKNNKIPKVNPELEGLDLRINEFGEMISNIDMDKINEFLTRTVPDKKLINRNDDQYQQEFKAMGLGAEGDDEEAEEFVEETEEEDEDNPDIFLKEETEEPEETDEKPSEVKKPAKKKK